MEPIRIVRKLARLGGLGEGAPFAYAACFPDHFPVQGRAKPDLHCATLRSSYLRVIIMNVTDSIGG